MADPMVWEYCKIEWIAERVSGQRKATLEADTEAAWQFHPQEGNLWLAMRGTRTVLVPAAEQMPEAVDHLHAVIARLGIEGWELVSRTERHVGSRFKEVFYFKRPRRETI